jgi:hypothetical protein
MVLKTREMRLRVDFLDLGFDLGEMRLRETERTRESESNTIRRRYLDMGYWGRSWNGWKPGRRRESFEFTMESLKIENEITKEAQLGDRYFCPKFTYVYGGD